MQTTLNKIKSHKPCEYGGKKLLNFLCKTEADDEPLELRTILESNGVEDTLWAFRAVEGKDKDIRLFAADCAELVLPIYEKEYPNDDRPRRAIQAARDYANRLISSEKLYAAEAAARAASMAAGAAAWAAKASRDAAWAAKASRAEAVRVAASIDAEEDEIKELLLKYI